MQTQVAEGTEKTLRDGMELNENVSRHYLVNYTHAGSLTVLTGRNCTIVTGTRSHFVKFMYLHVSST